MVDRAKRDKLAELMRHLAAGRITTSRFADECEILMLASSDLLASDDGALPYVSSGGPDIFYVPRSYWPRRLRGRHRLPKSTRKRIAIAAMFLYSEYEYEWPDDDSLSLGGDCALFTGSLALIVLGIFGIAMSVASPVFPVLGVICFAFAVYLFYVSNVRVDRARKAWIERCQRIDAIDVWPFFRHADFEQAKKHPRLLAG